MYCMHKWSKIVVKLALERRLVYVKITISCFETPAGEGNFTLISPAPYPRATY